MSDDPLRCCECGGTFVPGYRAAVCPSCLLGGDGEPPSPAAQPGGLALRVPGHEVIEEIARGGMGVVYRARESETQRTVALKMLRPRLADESGMRERFRLEARSIAALDHPSILPVYRVDEAGDLPFFTMKLVTGGTLHDRLPSLRGRWREIAGLMADVADAVHYAHQHGVLHRDLKPANVLFDDAGKPWLSDFGLAKLIDSAADLTRSIGFLGTPHYAAPEVAARSAAAASAASDCWSMGAMLYELLSGRPPFHAEGVVALLRKIVEEPPPALPAEVPRDLAVICGKCLTKDEAGRYPSADALAGDLRCWLDGRAIVARPMGGAEKCRAWLKRNPALAGMAAALAAMLVFSAVAIVRESRSARHAASVSRDAESSARRSEAAASLDEARAHRRAGDFLQRDRGLAAALRSWQIQPSTAARDEYISLLALPGIAEEGHALPDSEIGGWYARPDATLARYAGLTATGTTIRSVADGAEIAHLPVRPISNYPPGPLSPDGRRIVLRMPASTDILDVASGEVLLSLPPLRGTASFSADGRWFLLSQDPGHPGPPRLCDLAASPPAVRPVTGLPDGWVGLQLSPAGDSFVASAPHIRSGLHLIQSKDFAVRMKFNLPSNLTATHMAWSADGKIFVTCSHTGHAVGWSPHQADPIWLLNAHDGAMISAGFFNRGNGLVTLGLDHRTRFWNLTTSEAAGSLPWSGFHVGQTPDGERLLAHNRHKRHRPLLRCTLPDVCAVTQLPPTFVANVYHAGSSHALALPGGGFAVAGGIHTHLLDAEGSAITTTLEMFQTDSLVLDAGRRRLIQRRADRLVLKNFANSGEREIGRVARQAVLSLAPSGALLIAADPHAGFAAWRIAAGDASIPELMDPAEIGLPAGARVAAAAWSPDGKSFAWSGDQPALSDSGTSAERQSGTWICTPASGTSTRAPFSAAAAGLDFADAGNLLVAVIGGEIQCADLAAGTLRWKLAHRTAPATAVRLASAPGGRLLAVTLDNECVSLLDPATGRIELNLTHPDGRGITALAFDAAEGKHLCVVAGSIVQTWNIEVIRQRLAEHGMTGQIAQARAAAEGRAAPPGPPENGK